MKVGNDISVARGAWTFGGGVADSFVDHARLSIPEYDRGHDLVCYVSDFFCREDSVCYELGASTGELLGKLARYQKHKPGIQWIGLEREAPMVEKARAHCADLPNVRFDCEDLRSAALEKSDFIVSYYCLQFIPPRYRQDVFNRIYESLNWGGAFVLFEKVRGPDARFQDMATSLYNDFKQRNGLSAEEILNKTASLKSVMEPFSTQGNLDLLARAGFKDVMSVFKYICFEGFVAIK